MKEKEGKSLINVSSFVKHSDNWLQTQDIIYSIYISRIANHGGRRLDKTRKHADFKAAGHPHKHPK